MTCHPVRHHLLRLVPAALAAGATLLSPAEPAWAQAPRSFAPVAAIVEPVFPSWYAGDVVREDGVDLPGSAIRGRLVPTGAMVGAAGTQSSSSVALPELQWWTDGVLGALGLGGNAIGLTLSVTRQAVPEEGLDPSNINWGIDRDAIGNPSTSAESASDVAALATLAGAPVLALLTQPGVHGFGNVVRRPVVLYGESVLLAQAITQVLKPAISRPRPFTYLPAAERPTDSGYDVTLDHAFLSMPSGHAATTFAAASYAATDNLLSQPKAGTTEHVAIATIGGLLAGLTANLRVKANQHFPSDVLVGGLIGTASGVSVPLLHSYVLPGGGKAPHPGGHDWLVTAAGYVVGTGAGVGLAALAY
jgi:membrane-associated phospholipid phosphatase